MKLGCSSWSYHAAFRAGRIDLREWLRLCAEEMELDGVELVDLHFPTADPIYLRDIKKLCADLQLTVSGVAVSNDFGADERRPLEVDKVRQWCDIAAYIGAPVVRVFAGWLPVRRSEPEPGRIVGLLRKVFGQPQPNARRIWSDATWALRQCADYAAERGVVLALQNNRSEGLVATPFQLDQCVRDVGSPWLRICLDPADFADRTGVDMALPRVVQVHARFNDVAGDGSDPAIPWPQLLQMLKLGRYRGFLHVDYEGLEEPETAVPRAVRYIRGLLHLIERQHLLQPPRPEQAPQETQPEPKREAAPPEGRVPSAPEAEATVAR